MTSHSTAPSEAGGELAELIARAHVLLDRFSAFTEEGIAALTEGRLESVSDVLEARVDMVATLGALLQTLSDPATGAADHDRGRLSDHIRAVQVLDTRFLVALGAELQRVGQELELLDGEESVRLAYGQTPPTEGRTINLVR